ncbi:O-antigen ligase family protein [Bacillus sp. FSL K6-0047]
MALYYLLVILVSAFSWRPLFPEVGGEFLTVLRALLLVVTLFIIFRRGIRLNGFSYLCFVSILLLTIFMFLQLINLSNVTYSNVNDVILAYSSYLLIFLTLLIKISKKEVNTLLKILIYLPLISVFGGIVFSFVTEWSVIKNEYTGVFRLQGSNPPAHLAELSFVAVITSVLLIIFKERAQDLFFTKKNTILLLINLLIVVGTFTRITILGVSFIIAFLLLLKIIEAFRKNKFNLLYLSISAFLIIPIIGVSVVSFLMLVQRSSIDGDGINTSGRYWAWRYFLENALEHPLVGRGMGASNSLYEVNPHKEFVAPHNEYLRMFLEVGTIGVAVSIIMLLLFVYIFYINAKRVKVLDFKWVLVICLSIGIVAYYDNLFVTVHFSMPFTLLLMCLINIIETIKKGGVSE